MGRKKSSDGRLPAEGFPGRLQTILDERFGSNQRELSRRIGVSQSYLSLVLQGESRAGAHLAAAIAGLPGVNPEWVYDGHGAPFLWSDRAPPPVARVVLPGPPEKHPDLLTGERFPIGEVLDSPSRYFYRLPGRHPLLDVAELRLLQGDLLLVDANPASWSDNLGGCVGAVFAVRVARRGLVSFELGVLGQDRGRLFIDLSRTAEPTGRSGERVRLAQPDHDEAPGEDGPAKSEDADQRRRPPLRKPTRPGRASAYRGGELDGAASDLVGMVVCGIRIAVPVAL